MLLTVVLVRGIRESAETNNIMVLLKIAPSSLSSPSARTSSIPANYHPFSPNGWSGVLTGGSIIFFTYIGFDSVSTAAEECKNPQRDVPIGIIATLVVCTILYIGVAVVLTGLVQWPRSSTTPRPSSTLSRGLPRSSRRRTRTGLASSSSSARCSGMISSILVFQLGQARVWFAMSRDRLLPDVFSKVHPRFRTPDVATWVAGFVVGIPAGLLDIGTLADLSNIGTLFAFVLVSAGVLILRYKDPNRHRGFRCPGRPRLSRPQHPLLHAAHGRPCPSSPGCASSSGSPSASSSTSSTAASAANFIPPKSHERRISSQVSALASSRRGDDAVGRQSCLLGRR